jgi:thiol-disulfide isomerase/thioredoxin
VVFTSKQESTQSIGVFHQKGQFVSGTFLTPGGDYRFLEGGVFDDTLKLSVFDGNHTYLFKAVKTNDSTLTGQLWSHKNEYFEWTGIKKENPSLPNPEKITKLKPNHAKLKFCFPDVTKKQICFSDTQYKNKVVIIPVFGTWCPNSMDVTRFLSEFYDNNKQRGIEVIGLAYERKDNFNYASERVQKTIEIFNVDYPVLLAGNNDYGYISETLPALEKFVSIPTILIVGKDGRIKYTYTGFSGPGTGPYYEQLKTRFNEMIDSCLAEHVK